jgi:hypothetical protein
MSPKKVASGYRNAIGVIVRETVHITCSDLWAKDEVDIRKSYLGEAVKTILLQDLC